MMLHNQNRKNAKTFPQLRDGDIHLWQLEQHQTNPDQLKKYLSDDERTRARRYFRKQDKTRSIISRGILRVLLANYLNDEPQNIQFNYPCVCGKPDCPPSRRKPELASASDIQFSVSHSGDLIVYAFTTMAIIGVDVEQCRYDIDINNITKNFFAPSEFNALQALASDVRRDAFFQCWTRKEAYIKAYGTGFSHRLDKFEISVSPHESPTLLADALYPDDISRWTILDFKPSPDYAGSLAVNATDIQLKTFFWNGEHHNHL